MISRVVALGDLHCGHIAGLTPPGFWYPEKGGGPVIEARAKIQRAMWAWYQRTIQSLGPINLLIANGDLIDGKGQRSGSTEQTTSDMRLQAEMAAACLKVANPKNIFCTYGTPYHVAAEGEDCERLVADMLGARIEGHGWIEINGIVFDVKHKVGGSAIPHGRHTAIAKEKLWNSLWSLSGGQPRAQVFLRSHVHYHASASDPEFIAMTLPALQGFGSKYGIRQCSGLVHFGIVVFDVADNGSLPAWQALTAKPKTLGEPKAWKI